MSTSTRAKVNTVKAVCYLFVVAVLTSGCTLGRAYMEFEDVSVNPTHVSPKPVIP